MGEITARVLETLDNIGMSQKEFCLKTGNLNMVKRPSSNYMI